MLPQHEIEEKFILITLESRTAGLTFFEQLVARRNCRTNSADLLMIKDQQTHLCTGVERCPSGAKDMLLRYVKYTVIDEQQLNATFNIYPRVITIAGRSISNMHSFIIDIFRRMCERSVRLGRRGYAFN